MERRAFLKWLGIIPAVLVSIPAIAAFKPAIPNKDFLEKLLGVGPLKRKQSQYDEKVYIQLYHNRGEKSFSQVQFYDMSENEVRQSCHGEYAVYKLERIEKVNWAAAKGQ